MINMIKMKKIYEQSIIIKIFIYKIFCNKVCVTRKHNYFFDYYFGKPISIQ